MDEIEEIEENKHGKKKFKIISILIVFFVIIPLIIFSILYFNNKAFKQGMNKTFSKMPGVMGGYFSNYPTEQEKRGKIDYLAKHFLDLEADVAADKIYIIKKEDEELYIDLIRDMNSISAKKTEDIVLKIRNMELRKDLLFSTYEEAKDEEKKKMFSEVSRIENQDILLSIIEIENKFSDKEFVDILDKVDVNKISEILYFTEEDISNYILNMFKIDKRDEIKRLVYTMEREENKLKDIAKIYETKAMDSAINEIGNSNNYSMKQLATIYMNLSNIKAAELLYSIGDEKFVENLFTEIGKQNQMKRLEKNITEDISKAMEFITDYNIKIKDLVKAYEKMNPGKVAEIVEKMINETEVVTSLELMDEDVYNLSDSLIIIDVLSKVKNQTLSKVLDFMEAKDASKVTRELAKPKENN